jgi:hypothetical protein
MNQLLWYYAELEKQKCMEDTRKNFTTVEHLLGGRKSSRVSLVGSNSQVLGPISYILIHTVSPTDAPILGLPISEKKNYSAEHGTD